jgi:hypothetical protein
MAVDLEPLRAGVDEPVDQRRSKSVINAKMKEPRLGLSPRPEHFGIEDVEDLAEPRHTALSAMATEQDRDRAKIEELKALGSLNRRSQGVDRQDSCEIDQCSRHACAGDSVVLDQLVWKQRRRMDPQAVTGPAAPARRGHLDEGACDTSELEVCSRGSM